MHNWMAKLAGTHDPQSIIGRLNSFFLSCPLYGALTMNPGKMYHGYLCEFWYTAHFQAGDDHTIHYTLKKGSCPHTITVDSLRDALRLNYFFENELPLQLPTGINLREVCRQMGHTDILDEQGVLKRKGTIYMSKLADS